MDFSKVEILRYGFKGMDLVNIPAKYKSVEGTVN